MNRGIIYKRMKETIRLYKQLLKEAFKAFSDNSIFMYVGVLYAVTLIFSALFTAQIPLFGRLINIMVISACISSYLYIVDRAALGYKVDQQDLKNGVGVYLRTFMGIMILYNFGMMIISYITMSFNLLLYLFIAIEFIIIIIFNPLPETVAVKHYFVMDSLKYALYFAKRYLVKWFLPNLLVIVIFYVIQRLAVQLIIMVGSQSLSPQSALLIVINLVVLQFVGGIVMIFRNLLFRALENNRKVHNLKVVK